MVQLKCVLFLLLAVETLLLVAARPTPWFLPAFNIESDKDLDIPMVDDPNGTFKPRSLGQESPTSPHHEVIATRGKVEDQYCKENHTVGECLGVQQWGYIFDKADKIAVATDSHKFSLFRKLGFGND